ncbi:hypothetical protein ACGTN9_13975 [Halobacillus sp. MO56]
MELKNVSSMGMKVLLSIVFVPLLFGLGIGFSGGALAAVLASILRLFHWDFIYIGFLSDVSWNYWGEIIGALLGAMLLTFLAWISWHALGRFIQRFWRAS